MVLAEQGKISAGPSNRLGDRARSCHWTRPQAFRKRVDSIDGWLVPVLLVIGSIIVILSGMQRSLASASMEASNKPSSTAKRQENKMSDSSGEVP